ncbi:MAG: methyltransferase domain-containing protein [Steroidobacteraceae bacterium]
MYVCPQCKAPLVEFACSTCRIAYPVVEEVPCFLVSSPTGSTERVRDVYDDIYTHHENVWIDQGRSERFQSWFSDLAASFSTGPLLEIGCGEGILLAAFRSATRFGIDPSHRALTRARKRSPAQCAMARAEELPFPSGSFDVIVSVGVMEHFENPDAATAEICRVLTPSGRYLALIHRDMTRGEQLRLKLREFLFPLPRPVALARWVRKKLIHRIVQPLSKSYTIESARAILERNGLRVTRIIVGDSRGSVPLAGPHVVIFVAEKPAS